MAFSLQDYEIIEEIGRGGFGTVLRARKKSLGRIVAIKSLAAHRSLQQKEIVRFRREAEAMALLTHDNIITVFDYAYYSNNYYIVMEYIDGITLDDALTIGISARVALFIMEKVVSGLKAAHAEKVIHRDIKPSNILLGRQGQVKLADFGLATFQPDVSRYSSGEAVLGTFCYMAPEAMVTPKEIDARVDIFSLGCILYRILTGALPFPGSTIGEVSYKVLNEAPAPVQQDDTSLQEVVTLTLQCIEKDREKRPSLDRVHSALQKAVAGQYHLAQEELQKYVTESRRDPDTATRVQTQHTIVEKRKSRVTVAVVVGVVLLLAAGILFSRRFFTSNRSNDGSLPQLSNIRNTKTVPGGDRIGKQVLKKLSAENPKPLTSTSLDVATGTLIISGVGRKDSITLNGSIFPGKKEHGKCKATLKPGHYRVEVYRRGEGKIVRKIRVMPYQVMVLDVENERMTDERDTGK